MSNVVLFDHRNDEVERPEGVRTQWVSITPNYATKVLDEYEKFCDSHPEERKNRPIHQSQVNIYKQDMIAGRWGRNHQGIAFDRNGILMDGQHRLWAVVESDVTVMMPVTHGLDREAQLTIDSGLKRTTADVAAIAGFTGVKAIHIGIAKAIVRGVSATKPTWTRMQELEHLTGHWKAVEFVMENFPRSKVPGISRAPVMAAIARAFYTEDATRLKRFISVLTTGISSGDEREHVIITLRNWLMTDRRGGSVATQEAYGKATRALQAFLKGEKIRTLYSSRDDVFPLPVLRKK